MTGSRSDSYTVMVVAGEASGDAHGSHVAHELKQLLPGVRLIGLGGDEMIAEGVESVAHSRDISVVGFIEVLKILRRARQISRCCFVWRKTRSQTRQS